METPVLEVNNLKKYFAVSKGLLYSILFKRVDYVKAVDGISFDIKEKEIFVLAGETGCGKTTTGKVVLGLYKPTDGQVKYKGFDIFRIRRRQWRRIRHKLQMIYQDPYESLNPRQRVFDIISEPLRLNKLYKSKDELYDRVMKVMEDVKLVPPEDFMIRYPHELSGGQRQRVAIARAIVTNPDFIVADEPVSMLDASLRASILNLLLEFREKLGVTYLYITHDLATARYVGDRMAIMYLGQIVEMGNIDDLIENPQHPYTQALISSIPVPDPEYTRRKRRIRLEGEPPTPINPPSGCRFHPRCPYRMDICEKEEPTYVDVKDGHIVKCWLHIKR